MFLSMHEKDIVVAVVEILRSYLISWVTFNLNKPGIIFEGGVPVTNTNPLILFASALHQEKSYFRVVPRCIADIFLLAYSQLFHHTHFAYQQSGQESFHNSQRLMRWHQPPPPDTLQQTGSCFGQHSGEPFFCDRQWLKRWDQLPPGTWQEPGSLSSFFGQHSGDQFFRDRQWLKRQLGTWSSGRGGERDMHCG